MSNWDSLLKLNNLIIIISKLNNYRYLHAMDGLCECTFVNNGLVFINLKNTFRQA